LVWVFPPPSITRASHALGKLTYLPADIEGHVGTDGRRYLIDVSRLFPAFNIPCSTSQQPQSRDQSTHPISPTSSLLPQILQQQQQQQQQQQIQEQQQQQQFAHVPDKWSHLYKMCRPELLKYFLPVRLCSDTYSTFLADSERKLHANNVERARNFLFEQKVVKWLDEYWLRR
jgi:hypothetical protein